MTDNPEKDVFFKDFEGMAQGGYYVRNDLFKFLRKLREAGKNPVGIVVSDDWNLEVLVEVGELLEEENEVESIPLTEQELLDGAESTGPRNKQ